LSKRTDGQVQAVPTGLPYGDHQDIANQERTAPMSSSATLPSMPMPSAVASPPGGSAPQMPPFDQTQRPDEPITAGLDIGEGPGSEVLPVQHQPQYAQQGPMTQMLAQLSARDTTGVLAGVYANAQALNL
jgi:hypothetical protein